MNPRSPIETGVEKGTEKNIEQSLKLVSFGFFDRFLRENKQNIKDEKIGQVYLNLEEELKRFIEKMGDERRDDYARKLASYIFFGLDVYWKIIPTDTVKDKGIKKKIKEFLSKYAQIEGLKY